MADMTKELGEALKKMESRNLVTRKYGPFVLSYAEMKDPDGRFVKFKHISFVLFRKIFQFTVSYYE